PQHARARGQLALARRRGGERDRRGDLAATGGAERRRCRVDAVAGGPGRDRSDYVVGLLRRLAEREHLLAWVEVDDPAVLDQGSQLLPPRRRGGARGGAGAEPDRGGGPAGRKPPDLALEADGVGVVAGRRHDRRHRGIAAVFDEDFELLRVQL